MSKLIHVSKKTICDYRYKQRFLETFIKRKRETFSLLKHRQLLFRNTCDFSTLTFYTIHLFSHDDVFSYFYVNIRKSLSTQN